MKISPISNLAEHIANHWAGYPVDYLAIHTVHQLARQIVGKPISKVAYPPDVSETGTVPKPVSSDTLILTENPCVLVRSKFIFLQCKKPYHQPPSVVVRPLLPVVAIGKTWIAQP